MKEKKKAKKKERKKISILVYELGEKWHFALKEKKSSKNFFFRFPFSKSKFIFIYYKFVRLETNLEIYIFF